MICRGLTNLSLKRGSSERFTNWRAASALKRQNELKKRTRPGATSRRPETESVADALSDFRPLKFIQPPATIEGGDVMRVDRTLYAGLSGRTNREGVSQLRKIVEPHNYRVETIETTVEQIARRDDEAKSIYFHSADYCF